MELLEICILCLSESNSYCLGLACLKQGIQQQINIPEWKQAPGTGPVYIQVVQVIFTSCFKSEA